MPTFHIHANFFGNYSVEYLKSIDERSIFRSRKFELEGNSDDFSDVWICTSKLYCLEQAVSLSKSLYHILNSNCEVPGLIECESVQAEHVVKFQYSPFKQGYSLPEIRGQHSKLEKTCDIHIFRPFSKEHDELDVQIERLGFYAVSSSKQRIWTLGVSDHIFGVELFNILASFFNVAGGVFKIEYEKIEFLRLFGDIEKSKTANVFLSTMSPNKPYQ